MQPASHAIGKPSHPCTFVAPNSARPALASTRVSWVRSFIHSWRGLCRDASWPSGLWLSDYPLLRSLSIFEVQVCWILNCAWFSWQFGDAQQDGTGQSEDVFRLLPFQAWTVALACSIADLLRKPVAIVVHTSDGFFGRNVVEKRWKNGPRLRPFWSLWCRRATTNGLTRWSTSL